MHRTKRQTDLQTIADWIEPGQRVLDLGCGRGVLLEQLQQRKDIRGVGVDTDLEKVQSCIKRGVNVYQGDAVEAMKVFPDGYFDWVILSRTAHELDGPGAVIFEALRVGRHLAVGFVNFGYWRNRLALLRTGQRIRNEVYPHQWEEAPAQNPLTVAEFERFCQRSGIRRDKAVYLAGDWKTTVRAAPNLRAGYALYALSR